jgi:DNA gyrase subunit A
LIALANLDAIIALIRGAADTPTAKQELMESYELTEVQADAILQMQLRRLTALEADKIEQEHEELQARITDLQDILARRERILEIIINELTILKDKFDDPRRTVIEVDDGELTDISLIANEQVVILLTDQGYIKRMPVDTFEAQSRVTRGKSGTKMKEDDAVQHFITCYTHDYMLFFSDRGSRLLVQGLPGAGGIPGCSGCALSCRCCQFLKKNALPQCWRCGSSPTTDYLVMLTRGGYVKKTALSAFSNIRTNGLIAISLGRGRPPALGPTGAGYRQHLDRLPPGT